MGISQRRRWHCSLLGWTSTLKTEWIRSSETLVTTYKTTRRQNHEDKNRQKEAGGFLIPQAKWYRHRLSQRSVSNWYSSACLGTHSPCNHSQQVNQESEMKLSVRIVHSVSAYALFIQSHRFLYYGQSSNQSVIKTGQCVVSRQIQFHGSGC
jgi:hypothetical protein